MNLIQSAICAGVALFGAFILWEMSESSFESLKSGLEAAAEARAGVFEKALIYSGETPARAAEIMAEDKAKSKEFAEAVVEHAKQEASK